MSDVNEKKYSFEILNKGESDLEIKAVAPYSDFASWAKKYNEVKVIPGFRPGHAPIDKFIQPWAKNFVEKVFAEVVAQENIKNVYNLSYRVVKWDNEIEIRLEIQLCDNIPDIKIDSLTKHVADISQEDIENKIKEWCENNFLPAEESSEPAQIGDFVNITISNSTNKKEEDLTTVDIRLGCKQIVDYVENLIIGKVKGEIVSTSLQVDKEKFGDKINKTIEVKIKINSIRKAANYTTDSAIIGFKLNSQDELVKYFENQLRKETEFVSTMLLREDVKMKLIDIDISMPEKLINKEKETFRNTTLREMNYDGKEDLEQFIQKNLLISAEEFETQCYNVAKGITKLNYIASHVAEKFNIIATKEEINQLISEHSPYFDNNLMKTQKFFNNNPAAMAFLKQNLVNNKTYDFLISQCQNIMTEHHSLKDLYDIPLKKIMIGQNQEAAKEESKEELKEAAKEESKEESKEAAKEESKEALKEELKEKLLEKGVEALEKDLRDNLDIVEDANNKAMKKSTVKKVKEKSSLDAMEDVAKKEVKKSAVKKAKEPTA